MAIKYEVMYIPSYTNTRPKLITYRSINISISAYAFIDEFYKAVWACVCRINVVKGMAIRKKMISRMVGSMIWYSKNWYKWGSVRLQESDSS